MSTDLALRLWRDGYEGLPRLRRGSGGGDAFATSLAGHRVVVVRGRAGAELFYDASVVERHGAVPAPVADLLFGRGAVHGLDGEAHAVRKRLFLGLLDSERVTPLVAQVGGRIRERAASWNGPVAVFDELVEVYGAAVLDWAGIDLSVPRQRAVAHRLATIVDGFGGAPAAYPRAWSARLWADRWARLLVERVRAGDLRAGDDTVLGTIAVGAGRDLQPRVAAVELLNVLRPTVAVAWHGTFAALELSRHPQARERLAGGEGPETRAAALAFVHEVRRLSPFVPALAGRVRRPAVFGAMTVRAGDLLVLDVDGTNRDPRGWTDAEEFDPDRFAGCEPDPFGLVPQGGGDPRTGHRCPGEPLAVGILTETVSALAAVPYDVVSDPRYDVGRMPTRPTGGLVIRPAGT